MRYLFPLLSVLLLSSPVMAQESAQAPEAEQEMPQGRINFSHSLMFQPEALNKFMELYDTHQTLAARGEAMPVKDVVDLDIVSEAEQETGPEYVVFTLNSILWDKGRWTIWVNGRKYEKKQEGEPIYVGAALFQIVSVGRESATFLYQPSAKVQPLVQRRFEGREAEKQRFRSTLVKGGDVTEQDAGESYLFTLRPNQNFHTEQMVLTEGMVKLASPTSGEEVEAPQANEGEAPQEQNVGHHAWEGDPVARTREDENPFIGGN